MKRIFTWMKENRVWLNRMFGFMPIVLLLLGVILFFICPTGGRFSYRGFGVDQDERVYIGCLDGIWVYEDGAKIGRIEAAGRYGGAYGFYILEGDTLIYGRSDMHWHIDLTGDFLNAEDRGVTWSGAADYNIYEKVSKTDFYGNGKKYTVAVHNTWLEVYDETGACILSMGSKPATAIYVLFIMAVVVTFAYYFVKLPHETFLKYREKRPQPAPQPKPQLKIEHKALDLSKLDQSDSAKDDDKC